MRALKTTAAATAVMLAAGCGGTDFWGNPVNPTPEVNATCAQPVVVPEPDPGYGDRPQGIRPGNSWIVVGLEVRALSPDGGDNEYCVPVAIHMYSRSREADTVTLNDVGVEPGPVDVITSTPFTGRYMALQYDPNEERFQGRPPSYEFHIDAKYLADRDMWRVQAPKALRCAITIDGATVVQDLAVVTDRGSVQCAFVGTDSWRRY